MHKHIKNTPCNHKLKFCIECDVVYCEECHEEWGKNINVSTWPKDHGGPVPAPYNPYDIGDQIPSPFDTGTTPSWTIHGMDNTGCMWDGVPEGKPMMMVCPCPKCNTITM